VIHNFQNGKWTKFTQVAYEQASFSVGGRAMSVPIFGEDGILVFIGGQQSRESIRIAFILFQCLLS